MANTVIPKQNVFWKDIFTEKNVEIELVRNSIYVHYVGGLPNAMVYWSGQDAAEAQSWLSRHSFERCGVDECGVRLPMKNKSNGCGGHR